MKRFGPLVLFLFLFCANISYAQNAPTLDQIIESKDNELLVKAYSINADEAPSLEIIASFDKKTISLSITPENRMFLIAEPTEEKPYSVFEYTARDGLRPYPNKEWAGRPNEQGVGLVNPVDIATATNGALYVLDAGDATYQPRVLSWNTNQEQLSSVYYIPTYLIKELSQIRTLNVDWAKETFFINDAADGSFLPLGQRTGFARRVLNGQNISNTISTILPVRSAIYFASKEGGEVYKMKTFHALDEELSPEKLSNKVKQIGEIPKSTAMTVDAIGNLYVADTVNKAIGVLSREGEYSLYFKDERLEEVKDFAFSGDGYLYIILTENADKNSYSIARFKPLAVGALGR